MPAESDIRFETRGRLGLVTLDRRHALNALSHAMVLALAEALDRWEADPAIAHIVIRSVDEKAFSAGGDIHERRGGVQPLMSVQRRHRLGIDSRLRPGDC